LYGEKKVEILGWKRAFLEESSSTGANIGVKMPVFLEIPLIVAVASMEMHSLVVADESKVVSSLAKAITQSLSTDCESLLDSA
jgi:hypothetical protein